MSTEEPAGSSPRTPWAVHAACYVILACILAGAIAGRFLLPLTVGESTAVESSPLGADGSDEMVSDPAAMVRWRIDPNTATLDEWTRLPGIGEGLARKIIAYRDGQRPFVATRPGEESVIVFRDLADLKAVSGLNAATIERIAPYLHFAGEPLP